MVLLEMPKSLRYNQTFRFRASALNAVCQLRRYCVLYDFRVPVAFVHTTLHSFDLKLGLNK